MMFRQGDVLIVATDGVPAGVKPVDRDQGRVVLAYGEVTGHAHAIHDSAAELFAHDSELEDRFLRVLADGGVDLVHEEHSTITLPKGDYRVRIQREYEPDEGSIRVAD